MLTVKRFKLPGLEDDTLQLAFQMLVAGVGAHDGAVRHDGHFCYQTVSHGGDHIGLISVITVHTLIHKLRANYAGCTTRKNRVMCYEKPFRWHSRHGLADITFGWNEFTHPFVEGLMEKFWNNPVTRVVHYDQNNNYYTRKIYA